MNEINVFSASEKKCNSQKANLNTSIINAKKGDEEEKHKYGTRNRICVKKNEK